MSDDFFLRRDACEFSITSKESSTPFKFYSNSIVIFLIDKDGQVWYNDKNVTDDDAALAECFRQWIKLQTNITIGAKKPDA